MKMCRLCLKNPAGFESASDEVEHAYHRDIHVTIGETYHPVKPKPCSICETKALSKEIFDVKNAEKEARIPKITNIRRWR